nr:reverse transcriptase domain-containing protein [Tanacetum cinerariifolium]
MRTRSSSNLVRESSPNLTSSNPKRRNRRRSKQPFILKDSPIDTMADQRTMVELLRAPTEGYAEAIMVPPIFAEHFELKHSLINMMTSDQFFELKKDNPHDHICWFNKITSTIEYKDMPNLEIKLMLFSLSLAGASRHWLKKEPPRSNLTLKDLFSKFINELFPPLRTTNIRNEISNFQQRFDESFHEAWDRYKDILRACPYHGFTKFHELDTFYNALNPTDQDSLNSVAGGNLLERRTQDVLTIIENKSKQTSVVSTAMTAILKQFQATPPLDFVKAVEEICVTCGGAHPYYQCLAVDGNTFSEFQDNIQGYVSAAAVNYNQVVPLSELEKIKKMNEINIKAMQIQINNMKNELRNEMKTLIQASMSNQTNELKNMIPSFFQMNIASTLGSEPLPSNTIANPKGELKAITTRSGLVLDGPSVPMPPPFINTEEDKRVEHTLTDPKLGEYTNKVPPPLVQKAKTPSQRSYVVHQRDPHHLNIPYPSRMHKQKQQDKDEIQIHKFCELKCKTLANLGASINLMPLLVWKTLGLPELISTRMTLELVNWAICTPARIARDVFVSIEKFTIPADFIIVDYESNPRVPLFLAKPFLRAARALIDVHGEEMILRDDDERLTMNMRHETSSYSNQPQKESINMINIYDDSCEDYLEDLFATNHLSGNPTFSSHTDFTSPEVKDDIFDPERGIVLTEKLLNLDSTKDLHPPHNINTLSGNTTSSSPDHLLKEFIDELALITFPPGNDDLLFDIESDLKEIEYLLNHDPTKEMDYILEDSVNKCNPANPNDNLVDTILEMFIEEHTLDYSSPPLYDNFDDDLDELESDNDDVYDDPFDSNEAKIKVSKLLIDELEPPRSSNFFPSPRFLGFLKTRARGFVLRSVDLHILSFILGI